MKRVRWSTVTIHEFGVGHGGSAVPQRGPSIGLSQKPEFTWSTRVGAMARECDGVRRFTSAERIALLRSAGFSSDRVDEFVREAKRVRRSRALYYSSEMKAWRAARKNAKQTARAANGATQDNATTSEQAVEAATKTDDQDEVRIDAPKAAVAAVAAPPSPSLVPPVLPLNEPCCS